jgi:hypothetical protein
MACVEEGDPALLRVQAALYGVPRTTDPANCSDTDPKVVHTPAGVTAHLDREGWFLARYMKGILIEAFRGFGADAHLGDLPEPYCKALREALILP